MSRNAAARVVQILDKHEGELLTSWLDRQLRTPGLRRDLIGEAELREQSREFLRRVRAAAVQSGVDVDAPAWGPVREQLRDLSSQRARQGFNPSETATFVFSLKEPLFDRLRQEIGMDAGALAEETWTASVLLDRLGLYTTEVYQQSREDLIARQNQAMLELSTPVIKLWEGVLALPMIGTLDSARTQIVMESLLQKIVETGSEIAIMDITGVPTVDTVVVMPWSSENEATWTPSMLIPKRDAAIGDSDGAAWTAMHVAAAATNRKNFPNGPMALSSACVRPLDF